MGRDPRLERQKRRRVLEGPLVVVQRIVHQREQILVPARAIFGIRGERELDLEHAS